MDWALLSGSLVCDTEKLAPRTWPFTWPLENRQVLPEKQIVPQRWGDMKRWWLEQRQPTEGSGRQA